MSPMLSSARLRLSYPLYSADFDSLNPDFLIVGGGGGYSATGVPNKITLLDASRRYDLSEVVDIELPKDGDSVSSLAVAQSDETSLTAFAGINSSLAEQKAGTNEHFRSFRIGLPPRKAVTDDSEKKPVVNGKSEALASISLFSQPASDKNEGYQRVTRASRPTREQTEPLVAVGSSLALENEVVVLKVTAKSRTPVRLTSLKLGKAEAADIDFTSSSETGLQSMAYCTDDKVYIQQIPTNSGSAERPVQIYETPEAADRPKFRALRYLTPRHVLLLQNMPRKTGAELLILQINGEGTQGQIRLQKRLHKATKSAVGLDVCLLSESAIGEKQIIIAIAGQNSTVELLTLEFSPAKGMSTFRAYNILREVHSGPITKLCFSNYIPPPTPVTKEVRPQHVKLATVGVDKTVVVHTLPLRPFPPTYSKSPRYVLVPPGKSEALQNTFSVFMAILVVGLAAFLLQAFSEIRGAVPPTLGASKWLSPRVHDMIARPYIFADGPILPSEVPTVSAVVSQVQEVASDLPSVATVTDKLRDLVQQHAEQVVPQAIVMRDTAGELATELHHEADAVAAETVKKWDELTEREKKGWKQRLRDTGHWSADQGESVLKGIFFSELAGVVGDIVRGA